MANQRSGQPRAEAARDGAGLWTELGERPAAVFTSLLTAAWGRVHPDWTVVRGNAPPATLGPSSAVVRLGPPVDQSLWFFWGGGGPEAGQALEHFLSDMTALLPWSLSQEHLDPATPLPADLVLLPFRGGAGGSDTALTVGVRRAHLRRLAETLLRVPSPTGAGGRSLTVDDIEVESAVFVGGGMYPLATLSGLRPGMVLPLPTDAGEPVVLAVSGRVVARGEIMVAADGTLAVRLTEVLLGEDGLAATPSWLVWPHASDRGGSLPRRPSSAGA